MRSQGHRAGPLTCLVLSTILLAFGLAAPASEPTTTVLPAPQVLTPTPGPWPPVHSDPLYFRTNRYDVWQYYGVDRRGYFRPRVVLAPGGAYYLYNGKPFPWTVNHSLDFMPYVVD